MPDAHGRFVWYELMTTDPDAAQVFYTGVVGWGAQDAQMPGMRYTLFTVGDVHVGGLMELPEDARRMGAPPSWVGYVAVRDVDKGADRVKRRGGAVHVAPRDIPNVGRFAIIADPGGAALALFKSANPGPDQPGAERTPGRIGWHELSAADWEKAFAFYSDLFGWKKAEAMDMGPMGTYQLFSLGGQPIGGMFNKPSAVPRPFWLYYVNVDNIDAASERVKGRGGRILMGPQEVPGGDWIIQGMDPQGAMFALVGPRR